MIHYTPPGIVGGVEQIIQRHAALFEERGITVDVAAGRSSTQDLPVHVIPEIDAAAPANVAIEHELAAGAVSPRFHDARQSIARKLTPLVDAADAVIVHNAFTLHFSLPLTAVLWQLAGAAGAAFLAWTHDVAWINPLYIPAMHGGYPWDLLRVPAPGVHYVTVSHERKAELQRLWGDTNEPVTIVPNGVDVAGLLRLSERIRQVVDRYSLLDLDLILLLPVRITRRKNIEKAIETVRVLKDRGLEVRLIVTGPTAPHHPDRSRAYLVELKLLRSQLGLESDVVFLADDLGVTLEDTEIAELYSVSDCLFLPSESEGFGLPILEAGVLRVPVVLTRLPIFCEVGANDVSYFSLDDEPTIVADTILRAVDTPTARLRRRVRREYRWDVIVDRIMMPLLATFETGSAYPTGASA
jgi:glycosyltransferase involved in cell wall biosynthesis